jgi:hypothetical protein
MPEALPLLVPAFIGATIILEGQIKLRWEFTLQQFPGDTIKLAHSFMSRK